MGKLKKQTKISMLIIVLLFIVASCILIASKYVTVNYVSINSAKHKKLKSSTTTDMKFEYQVLGNGTIEITKYIGNDTNVIIPSTIEGIAVTRIGERAFSYCSRLTSIKIPNSVMNFGDSAMNGCSKLTIYCRSNSKAKEYAINNDIAYKIDDATPTISDVIGNSTVWTKSNVELLILGANDDIVGLANKPYSFDGGETWQEENNKIYEENTEGIVIKVRDAVGNVYTHNETINITKIDKTAPIIESVTGNPENWTNEDVIVTVTATDNLSCFGKALYSFNGGKTWQEENYKRYGENIDGIEIQIKDQAGNITEYGEIINITKIDKTVPTVENVISNPNWTNQPVRVSIKKAEDTESGLAEYPYSFNGGETWEPVNTKEYTENTSGIEIKVKDAAGNIYTHDEVINITKIDKIAPTIGNVTEERIEGKAALYINEVEDVGVGLAEKPYSFDGGGEWQAENVKTYTESTAGIVIKVKDALGNERTHEEIINIHIHTEVIDAKV